MVSIKDPCDRRVFDRPQGLSENKENCTNKKRTSLPCDIRYCLACCLLATTYLLFLGSRRGGRLAPARTQCRASCWPPAGHPPRSVVWCVASSARLCSGGRPPFPAPGRDIQPCSEPRTQRPSPLLRHISTLRSYHATAEKHAQ